MIQTVNVLLEQMRSLAQIFSGETVREESRFDRMSQEETLSGMEPEKENIQTDTREEDYSFADAPDPARYFYSQRYMEQLSGYLETDSRRYEAQDMAEEGESGI